MAFAESFPTDLGISRMERWEALADVMTVSSSDITLTVNSGGKVTEVN